MLTKRPTSPEYVCTPTGRAERLSLPERFELMMSPTLAGLWSFHNHRGHFSYFFIISYFLVISILNRNFLCVNLIIHI